MAGALPWLQAHRGVPVRALVALPAHLLVVAVLTLLPRECAYCECVARDLERALVSTAWEIGPGWQCRNREECRSRSLARAERLAAVDAEGSFRKGLE